MTSLEGKSETLELKKISVPSHSKKTAVSSHKETKKFNFTPMRGDALQMFKNNSSLQRRSLGEILTVFRKKYVRIQCSTATKHNF